MLGRETTRSGVLRFHLAAVLGPRRIAGNLTDRLIPTPPAFERMAEGEGHRELPTSR